VGDSDWTLNLMIPTSIQKKHVLMAAEWIDQHGVGGRDSRKYLAVINGKTYPPKLVISRAYFYAHGSEWSHENFTGGEETNSYLRGLGFRVVERGSFSDTHVERRGAHVTEKLDHMGSLPAKDASRLLSDGTNVFGIVAVISFFAWMGFFVVTLNTDDRYVFVSIAAFWIMVGSVLLWFMGIGPDVHLGSTPASQIGSNVTTRSSTNEDRSSAPTIVAESYEPRTTLDLVRDIAKNLHVRVDSLGIDTGGGNRKSFLVWHSENQDIWIGEDDKDPRHTVYVIVSIAFGDEDSACLGSIPEVNHVDTLYRLMHGETGYRIDRNGDAITGIELRQRVPTHGSGIVFARKLVKAIDEVVASDASVRSAYRSMIDSVSREEDKKSRRTPPDMYA
jgi:hypothetical protein